MSDQCCGTCKWADTPFAWVLKGRLVCNYPIEKVMPQKIPDAVHLIRRWPAKTDGANCPCYEPKESK